MVLFFFIFLVLSLLYIYLLYPLLLFIFSYRNKERKQVIENNNPVLTIVFVAFNEGKRILNKIDNLLNQNYPKEKIKIFIASDGSTDKTNEIIKSYSNESVKAFIFNEQKGKTTRLNQLLKEVRTPITVMCDVRQEFHPDAIAELVKNFNDPQIGAVSGELVLVDDTNSSVNLSLYWKYETFLRKAESVIDSTNGVTGAIYALRTNSFKPIPGDTILDDVLIPMQIVKQGFRVIFDPKAIAYDKVQSDGHKEYQRKVRTLAGNFQLIFKHHWLLNPFQNRIFFQFFSHKVLRLTVPFILIVLFILNLFLLDNFFFKILLVIQVVFHVTGIYHFIKQYNGKKISNKYARIGHTFYSLNIAVLEGLYQYLFKRGLVKWK